MKENNQNQVKEYITLLNHPLKTDFLEIRNCIITYFPNLKEHIKWNAPSYQYKNEDFLTFNLSSKKEVRLILHCGAKSKIQPEEKLIKENFVLLKWASNNRAIITFNGKEAIKNHQENLIATVSKWINAL